MKNETKETVKMLRKENNMNSDSGIVKLVSAALIFFALLVLIAIIVGFPIMWLWNDTLPHIFGVGRISFWEACEIFILCGILFRSTKEFSA